VTINTHYRVVPVLLPTSSFRQCFWAGIQVLDLIIQDKSQKKHLDPW